jgi:hypothetical protein
MKMIKLRKTGWLNNLCMQTRITRENGERRGMILVFFIDG